MSYNKPYLSMLLSHSFHFLKKKIQSTYKIKNKAITSVKYLIHLCISRTCV